MAGAIVEGLSSYASITLAVEGHGVGHVIQISWKSGITQSDSTLADQSPQEVSVSPVSFHF